MMKMKMKMKITLFLVWMTVGLGWATKGPDNYDDNDENLCESMVVRQLG